MTLDRVMALLLCLAGGLLGLLAAGIIAGAGQGAAVAHPDFAPMLRGVDGGTLGAPVWAGYAVGLGIIAMMWAAMLVGFRGRHWIGLAVTAWTVWYAVAFVGLVRSYAGYAAGDTTVVTGFAKPTAWLVYGVGLSPWILLLLITFTFQDSYWGPREEARFETILELRRASGQPSSPPDDDA